MTRALVVILFLFAARDAFAEDDREAQTRSAARAEKGIRFYNLGKFEQAIVEFEAAYEIWPGAELLFNLGQAHRQLNHCAKALFFYRRFLAQAGDSPLRKQVEERIADLERCLPPVDPMPPPPEPEPDAASDPEEEDVDEDADTDAEEDAEPDLDLEVDDEDADADLGEDAAVEAAAPRAGTVAHASLGPVYLRSGAGGTTQLAVAVGITVPVVRGRVPLHVGGGLHASRLTWAAGGSSGDTAIVSLDAIAATRFRLGRGAIFAEGGLGARFLSGLDDADHVLVSDGKRAPAVVTLLEARLAVGAELVLSGDWSARAAASAGWSPAAAGMRGGSFSDLGLLLGVSCRL